MLPAGAQAAADDGMLGFSTIEGDETALAQPIAAPCKGIVLRGGQKVLVR